MFYSKLCNCNREIILTGITSGYEKNIYMTWYALSIFGLWSLHVLVFSVLARFSNFLPQTKNPHVRSIRNSKILVALNVSVNGLLSLVGPATNWPFTGSLCLRPLTAGIGGPPWPKTHKEAKSKLDFCDRILFLFVLCKKMFPLLIAARSQTEILSLKIK